MIIIIMKKYIYMYIYMISFNDLYLHNYFFKKCFIASKIG